MKIHITGNAGSGKTTLAKKVSIEFDLPLFGLDKVVWRPGWEQTSPDTRNILEKQLISKPSWVIEGVSNQVRHAADITIFLDVPRYKCFARTLRRNLPYLFKSRPELPEKCPEYKILPHLFKIIWNFPDRVRPSIIREIECGCNILHLGDSVEYNSTKLKSRVIN